MSESSGIDVLMMVVGASGALAAESNTHFATTPVVDTLLSDFLAGKFCELQSFSFAAGVESSLSGDKDAKKDSKETESKKDDKKPGEGGQSYRQKMEDIYRAQSTKADKRASVDRAGNRRAEFVDMQPVEFTRVMDTMSPQLFTALTTCETLASISVVKRKATGGANSGNGYLRLDFSNVLLTNLAWTDGEHVVIETGTFIYRKLTMRYRAQKSDGSLDVPVQMAWEMKSAAGT